MPGPILHLGASVLCAHGGQATPTAPFPRVLVSGQPVATIAHAVRGRRLPVPAGVAGGPCVTAQWVVGATRVLAGGDPGRAPERHRDLRPDRHAAAADRRPAAGGGDVRADDDTSTSRSISTAAGRTADDRRRRAHPRPDRAGAVHRARRAGEPARRSAAACWRWSSRRRRRAGRDAARLVRAGRAAASGWAT